MKSNEHIKQLVKLSEDNPELEIKARVSTECCPSDEHTFWISEIGKSEIEEYWQTDEECFISEGNIIEHIEYVLDGELPEDADEADKVIQAYYNNLKTTGEIKTAIFVEIKP